jgi:hypothetical protein
MHFYNLENRRTQYENPVAQAKRTQGKTVVSLFRMIYFRDISVERHFHSFCHLYCDDQTS